MSASKFYRYIFVLCDANSVLCAMKVNILRPRVVYDGISSATQSV